MIVVADLLAVLVALLAAVLVLALRFHYRRRRTTFTVSHAAHRFYRGQRLLIEGHHYVVTRWTGDTITVRPS